MSSGVDTLVDEQNRFHYINTIENQNYSYEQVYKEMKAQLEKLLSYNVNIDHFDTHHFVAIYPVIQDAFLNIAKEYDLPIRTENEELRQRAKQEGIVTTDHFSTSFHKEGVLAETIEREIEKLEENTSIEIMTHVGWIDEETKMKTSYLEREKEIEELRRLKERGFYTNISLSTFQELKS